MLEVGHYNMLDHWSSAMSADIRYLSHRSLAVYEATVIDQFTRTHRRNVQLQAVTFALWASVFIAIATLTIVLPLVMQRFLQLLLPV